MDSNIGPISAIADDADRTAVAFRRYQLSVLDTDTDVMVLRVPDETLDGTIAEGRPGVETGWQVVATTDDMTETYDGEIVNVRESDDERVYRCDMRSN